MRKFLNKIAAASVLTAALAFGSFSAMADEPNPVLLVNGQLIEGLKTSDLKSSDVESMTIDQNNPEYPNGVIYIQLKPGVPMPVPSGDLTPDAAMFSNHRKGVTAEVGNASNAPVKFALISKKADKGTTFMLDVTGPAGLEVRSATVTVSKEEFEPTELTFDKDQAADGQTLKGSLKISISKKFKKFAPLYDNIQIVTNRGTFQIPIV